MHSCTTIQITHCIYVWDTESTENAEKIFIVVFLILHIMKRTVIYTMMTYMKWYEQLQLFSTDFFLYFILISSMWYNEFICNSNIFPYSSKRFSADDREKLNSWNMLRVSTYFWYAFCVESSRTWFDDSLPLNSLRWIGGISQVFIKS